MKFVHDSVGEYIKCGDAARDRDEKEVNDIVFGWLN